MSPAPRIAVPQPPRAKRWPARPTPRPPTPPRAFASTVLGVVAGLVTATVFVAAAPVVGRTPGADGAATASGSEVGDAARRGAATPPVSVSSILEPAIDVGVVPAPDPEAARP